jgi:hypothetical protein
MNRRIMTAAAVLFCVVASFAGAAGAEESATAEEMMTITWMARYKDSAGELHLEEKFGVNIEANGVWAFHEKENEDLMLATGNLPDVFPIGNLNELRRDGVIRSIPIAMMRKNMPYYAKFADQRQLCWLMNRDPDDEGALLAINGFQDGANGILVWTSFRADWAANVGMPLEGFEAGKVPLDNWDKVYSYDINLSLDWFEDLLIAFRDGDPDQNGKVDTIPMMGHNRFSWMWWPVAGAFGVSARQNVAPQGVATYEEGGKMQVTPISPRYKDFLTLAARWYELGLIDTEFPTLPMAKAWEKIFAGTTGVCFGTSAAYAGNPSIPNRPPTAFVRDEEVGTGAACVVVPPPIGPSGFQGAESYYNTTDGSGGARLFIHSRVDDKKLAKILQIVDYYKLDPEGRYLAGFGRPGVHFTWEGEPFRSGVTRVPEADVPAGEAKHGEFAMYPGMNPWDYLQYGYRKHTKTFYDYYVVGGRGPDLRFRVYKWDIFRETDMANLYDVYGEGLNTLASEYYYKAVTGQADVADDWDEYVAKWKSNGGDKYIAEMEKAPIVAEYLKGKMVY